MSNWSSFEKDKKYADKWRDFLIENEEEEIELDEGVWDRIKTAGAAGVASAKDAWHGHGVQQQFKKGAKARAAMAASGAKVADFGTDLATTGQVTGSAPPSEPEATAGAVALFTGDNALYSKLFSTILARFKNKEVAGSPIQLDKAAVQNTVKQILKDLSAQLRANGLKVQESNIPMLADLIVEELERTLLIEASKSSKRRERDYARSLKGSKMGTDTSHTSTATAGRGKKGNKAEKWVAAGKPELKIGRASCRERV